MPLVRNSSRVGLLGALVLLALGAGAWAVTENVREKPELGLLTTLPIYWSESYDISEAIDGQGSPHWVRTALEEHYDLVPLDTLDDEGVGIEKLDYLLMAQPRALSPSENVALDDWVLAGGRVLVFADPFLTDSSRFGIGDRRRPQDVVLLSPILHRWGLDLQFDPAQPDSEHMIRVDGREMPVNLAGSLIKVAGSASSECRLAADGLLADCVVGKGHVTVVADAALLEQWRGDPAPALLRGLTEEAFEN